MTKNDSRMIIIVVDDTEASFSRVKKLLKDCIPHLYLNHIKSAHELDGLLRTCQKQGVVPHAYIVDISLSEDADGIDVIRKIRAQYPQSLIVANTKFAEYRDEAIKAGADNFVEKFTQDNRLVEILVENLSSGEDSV
ncbi:MAG: response regulator [bacterium]